MSDAYGMICFLYRRWLKTTRVALPSKDVEALFYKFSDNQRSISEPKLINFLKDNQGEKRDSASEIARATISNYLKKLSSFRKKGLSLNGFLHYLLSEHNPPLAQKEDVMEAPLVKYFVYSSHHSYLKQELSHMHNFSITLNEKASKITETHSSATAIEKALRKGVRVIELDLWANSDHTDVDVHPEGTGHSSVSLKKCLQVIAENAFWATDFPVIIILNEHIETNLHAGVARRIRKIFDHMLCPPGEAFSEDLVKLKGKIIILSRHPRGPKQAPTSTNKNEAEAYEDLVAAHTEDLESGLRNLQAPDSDQVRIVCTTEDHLENVGSADIVSFTQKNLLLVYPNLKDQETFSSNYDPFIGWARGAQMVTFNVQNYEKNLWIMQGLFRAHGKSRTSGYVRKPDILLDRNQIFDPTAWRPVKKILKVKVYMGTGWHLDFDDEDFDATSPPDLFTALEIVGVPADEAREKTIPIMDQWTPTWDQEFEFPLTVPDLAMLMIEVKEFDPDRTHDFGGQTCLPVWLLRNGIRSVPLYDRKGKQYRSSRLLIGFQLD